MTNHPDHMHTMKMLAKVARGLDLPAPEVSSPLQPAAPLPDEDNFDERLFDNAPGTSEPQVSESIVEPAAAAETGQTESVPHMPTPAGMSDDNLSKFEPPRTGSFIGSTSSKETASLEPDTPSETLAYSAHPGSDTESPGSNQPASPLVAAELNEEIPGGQTEPLQPPDRIITGEKYPDTGQQSGVPRARWFHHRAGEHKSKAPQPVSRMLRPVFDTSAKESTPEPGEVGKTKIALSPDRRLELDRSKDLTQTLPEPPGTEFPTHLPDIQPATGARNRIPSRNGNAVSQLQGTSPATNKPLTNTNQPAADTAGSSANQTINRLQNKNTAAVRQIVPPAQAAKIGNHGPAPGTVSKDTLPAKTGEVSVGRINIQVRRKRQAEDDWPAPPRYASHTITEDWEWSCHYGR